VLEKYGVKFEDISEKTNVVEDPAVKHRLV
jgi:hypothetical protein